VLVDLTAAIQVGMVLSVFLFMRRVSEVTNINVLGGELAPQDEDQEEDAAETLGRPTLPPGVELYEINGLFFFGAAYKFREAMGVVDRAPKVRIIQMRHVLAIDATGIHVLKDGLKSAKRHGIGFILAEVQAQPRQALERAGLLEDIGEENVAGTMEQALARARHYLGPA
jgi:SulP family sulfate permease